MTLRACLVCGASFQPTAANTSRCERHPVPKVSRDRVYRNLAHRIIAASSTCGICGQPLGADPDNPPVVDHIIPRARGGTNDPANLQASHRRCNGAKSAKLPGPYRGGG